MRVIKTDFYFSVCYELISQIFGVLVNQVKWMKAGCNHQSFYTVYNPSIFSPPTPTDKTNGSNFQRHLKSKITHLPRYLACQGINPEPVDELLVGKPTASGGNWVQSTLYTKHMEVIFIPIFFNRLINVCTKTEHVALIEWVHVDWFRSFSPDKDVPAGVASLSREGLKPQSAEL